MSAGTVGMTSKLSAVRRGVTELEYGQTGASTIAGAACISQYHTGEPDTGARPLVTNAGIESKSMLVLAAGRLLDGERTKSVPAAGEKRSILKTCYRGGVLWRIITKGSAAAPARRFTHRLDRDDGTVNEGLHAICVVSCGVHGHGQSIPTPAELGTARTVSRFDTFQKYLLSAPHTT